MRTYVTEFAILL